MNQMDVYHRLFPTVESFLHTNLIPKTELLAAKCCERGSRYFKGYYIMDYCPAWREWAKLCRCLPSITAESLLPLEVQSLEAYTQSLHEQTGMTD